MEETTADTKPADIEPTSLTGTIVSRRCFGKRLSFATVSAADGGSLHRVLFHRDKPCWEGGSNFPERPSDLQHGSRVELVVQLGADAGNADLPVVRSWKVVSQSSDAAQLAGSAALASTTRLASDEWSADATAVSAVLASRGASFARSLAARGGDEVDHGARGRRKKRARTTAAAAAAASAAAGGGAQWNHGGAAAKRVRATVLATWLIAHFGVDNLARGTGVVDVAGGKGKLAIELALKSIPCTVVDPAVRKKRLSGRDAKRFRKAELEPPAHFAALFDAHGPFAAAHRALLEGAACLVGMHPDEATEAIVDAALRFDTSCAVVPCCVFARIAGERRLRSGEPVRTYEEFVEYLMEKDPRMRSESLPFAGRNVVVFLDGGPRTEINKEEGGSTEI